MRNILSYLLIFCQNKSCFSAINPKILCYYRYAKYIYLKKADDASAILGPILLDSSQKYIYGSRQVIVCIYHRMKTKDCHGQKYCYRNIEDIHTYIDFGVIGVNYWTKKRSISKISKHGKNTEIISFVFCLRVVNWKQFWTLVMPHLLPNFWFMNLFVHILYVFLLLQVHKKENGILICRNKSHVDRICFCMLGNISILGVNV